MSTPIVLNLHCTSCHGGFNFYDEPEVAWSYANDGGSAGFGLCPDCNTERYPWMDEFAEWAEPCTVSGCEAAETGF